MSEPIKLPPFHPDLDAAAFSFAHPQATGDARKRMAEEIKVYARLAVEQATAELRSELTAALATVARYETLRPASEHDGKERVLRWRLERDGWHLEGCAAHWESADSRWTPPPDVKEPK